MTTVRKKKSKPKTRKKSPVSQKPPVRWSAHTKLLVLLSVVALSLVVYIFVGFDGGSVQATGQSLAALQYRQEIVATGSLREAFTLDEFRYEVRGAVNRGSAYGFQKAEGKFIEVAIAAENSSAKVATPHAVSLIDKAGTRYAQLPQFSLDGTRYSEVMEDGLKPGSAGPFFALFDVASTSTDLWLAFHAHDGVAARVVQLGM